MNIAQIKQQAQMEAFYGTRPELVKAMHKWLYSQIDGLVRAKDVRVPQEFDILALEIVADSNGIPCLHIGTCDGREWIAVANNYLDLYRHESQR